MGAHMTPVDHEQIWDLVEAGESYASIGKVVGRRLTTVRDFVNKHDGLRPLPPKPRSEKRLSVMEREEISRGLALDESWPRDWSPAWSSAVDHHARGEQQRRPWRLSGCGCRGGCCDAGETAEGLEARRNLEAS